LEKAVSDSHDQDNSVLSRILRRVPGFGGYVEQEARQASDEQTRKFVTDQLHKTKGAIDGYAKALVEAANIDDAAVCNKLRGDVDTMAQHLRSRLPGHSSFFGASRIDEDQLEDIYDSDANLMDQAEELAELAGSLKAANESSAEVFNRIGEKVESLQQQLAERDRKLSEV
jgi:hypothetical protein